MSSTATPTLNPYQNPKSSEEDKILFLQQIEKELLETLSPTPKKNTPENSKIKNFFKKTYYHFMTILGPIVNMAGGYLFSTNLFTLIPGISHTTLISLGLLYVLLNSILYYAFDVAFFKNKQPLELHCKYKVDCISKQLESTQVINRLLSSIDFLNLDLERQKKYISLALLFNQDLQQKKEAKESYQESFLRKLSKWGMVSFGILSETATCYFLTGSFLKVVCPNIIGTPIGCSLIVFMIFLKLVYFYATRAQPMIDLVNPDRKRFEILSENLNAFEAKNEAHFEIVLQMKQALDRGRQIPAQIFPIASHRKLKRSKSPGDFPKLQMGFFDQKGSANYNQTSGEIIGTSLLM